MSSHIESPYEEVALIVVGINKNDIQFSTHRLFLEYHFPIKKIMLMNRNLNHNYNSNLLILL
jgi:hypothetical protein